MSSSSPSDPLTSHLSTLLRAAHYAAVAHSQQRRKSRAAPAYVEHPLDVARRLASRESSLWPNPPVEVLQAAVLHDTIEDTDVTAEDLRREFGEVVTKIGAFLCVFVGRGKRKSDGSRPCAQFSSAQTTSTFPRTFASKLK